MRSKRRIDGNGSPISLQAIGPWRIATWIASGIPLTSFSGHWPVVYLLSGILATFFVAHYLVIVLALFCGHGIKELSPGGGATFEALEKKKKARAATKERPLRETDTSEKCRNTRGDR